MTRPSRPLRVLIADDHIPTSRMFRQDLEAGGIEVCAEAGTGAEAIRAALTESPDLCLLDVHMPEGGGIGAATSILRSVPTMKIVLITALPDQEGVLLAARAGAAGYLAKGIDGRRLPHVLRAVADGETSYPRRLLTPLLRALQPPDRSGT